MDLSDFAEAETGDGVYVAAPATAVGKPSERETGAVSIDCRASGMVTPSVCRRIQ